MISKIKQQGFTIVELLIVIVVIAILAAISIAAYSNITARANTSTASAAAKSVRDVAQAYNSANAGWPTSKAEFVSGGLDAVAKLPNDINFVGTGVIATGPPAVPPTPANGPKTVIVTPRLNGGNVKGFEVTYFDYNTKATVVTRIGETTGAGFSSGTPLS